MATLKQTLKKHGFVQDPNRYADVFYLKNQGRFVGNSRVLLDISSYDRNARKATIIISGKRKTISFDYNFKTYSYKSPTEEQMARFEALVIQCREAAIDEHVNPVAKPDRAKPPKRDPLTEAQKAENKVWRWLGNFAAQGMIGKEQREAGLWYIRKGKFIRVEDEWRCMAYANIRQRDLDESNLGMTLDTLEEWLKERGVTRRREKQVKYIPPLYD